MKKSMIKSWALVLTVIAFPALAQTLTADSESSKQLANELQFCSLYFTNVSQCFADKNYVRRLAPTDKQRASELALIYDKQASLANKNAFKVWKASGMSSADFTKHLVASIKLLNDAIDGDCANIKTLFDKYGASCNQLVHNPLQRLKELSR